MSLARNILFKFQVSAMTNMLTTQTQSKGYLSLKGHKICKL